MRIFGLIFLCLWFAAVAIAASIHAPGRHRMRQPMTTTTQPGWSDTTTYAALWETETTNVAGNWLDTSGNNITSTNTGSLKWETGTNQYARIEHSIRLDGNDDVASSAPPPFQTNTFSVVCWVYLDDVSDAKAFVNMLNYGDSTLGSFHLGTIHNDYDDIQWVIADRGGALDKRVTTSANVLIPTNWYFICGTFTNGSAWLYLNGTQVGLSGTVPKGCASNSHPCDIGWFRGVGRFMDGEIDHVGVVPYCMTSNEQYNLWLNTHPTNNVRIR